MTTTPPIIRPAAVSRFTAIGLLGCAMLAVTGAWLLFQFDPATHPFYPVCFFYQSTGLQCPGCGSLRALHQLLHGRVAAAWQFNPLLVTALPLSGLMAIRFLLLKRQGRDAWRIPPAWLWTSLVIILVFALARNLHFWPIH